MVSVLSGFWDGRNVCRQIYKSKLVGHPFMEVSSDMIFLQLLHLGQGQKGCVYSGIEQLDTRGGIKVALDTAAPTQPPVGSV